MTHVTEHDENAIIGKHIQTVLGNDSIDWTGYWPVVDPDTLTVTAISDGDDDELVLADIVDGASWSGTGPATCWSSCGPSA